MVSYTKLLLSFSMPLMAAAQIVASCNPVSTTGCSPDPALATSFSEDFEEESEWFSAVSYPKRISYNSDGVAFTLAERLDNPALKSNFYIMFGKVEVTFKAASGTGIVSSFYLQSDDLDEIDLEWVGGDTAQVQTNFFSKGNVSTYDRGAYHAVTTPQEEYHNYTIDWTKDELVFYIDGTQVRTIPSDNASGYPQTPMYIATGIWAGGDPSNSAGTIEWAGGLTDFSQAPFTMYIKNVVVTDYSTGSEYKYTDQTGLWTSIQAVDGEVNGRESLGEQEFEILLAGGELENSSSSSSSSSSRKSSSQRSSSSPSSSESEETSSSYHGALESSKSRVSTVYSSSASSLVSRSSSSRSTIVSSTKRDSTPSSSSLSSSSSFASSYNNQTTITTQSSQSSTSRASSNLASTSSSASSAITEVNSALSLQLSIGETGIKALLLSIVMTLGLWMA